MSLYWTSGPQPWESHEEKIIIFKYKVKVTLLFSSEKPAWTWRWRRLFVFSLSFLSHRRRMNSTHRILVAPIFFLCIIFKPARHSSPHRLMPKFITHLKDENKNIVWWLFDSVGLKTFRFFVHICGTAVSIVPLPWGEVPQGSILTPVLFSLSLLLYGCHLCHCYADDFAISFYFPALWFNSVVLTCTCWEEWYFLFKMYPSSKRFAHVHGTVLLGVMLILNVRTRTVVSEI